MYHRKESPAGAWSSCRMQDYAEQQKLEKTWIIPLFTVIFYRLSEESLLNWSDFKKIHASNELQAKNELKLLIVSLIISKINWFKDFGTEKFLIIYNPLRICCLSLVFYSIFLWFKVTNSSPVNQFSTEKSLHICLADGTVPGSDSKIHL